jgi:hypothetical protein
MCMHTRCSPHFGTQCSSTGACACHVSFANACHRALSSGLWGVLGHAGVCCGGRSQRWELLLSCCWVQLLLWLSLPDASNAGFPAMPFLQCLSCNAFPAMCTEWACPAHSYCVECAWHGSWNRSASGLHARGVYRTRVCWNSPVGPAWLVCNRYNQGIQHVCCACVLARGRCRFVCRPAYGLEFASVVCMRSCCCKTLGASCSCLTFQ